MEIRSINLSGNLYKKREGQHKKIPWAAISLFYPWDFNLTSIPGLVENYLPSALFLMKREV